MSLPSFEDIRRVVRPPRLATVESREPIPEQVGEQVGEHVSEPSVPFTQTVPGLIAQVHEDWLANGQDWTRPGFQAIAVHRFGNWRMGLKSKFFRAPFSVLYRALFRGIRNFYGIELPYSTKVGRRVVIEHQSGIVIHGNAAIGDDCILRHQVTLGNRHPHRPLDAPRLGRGVNVGAGAKILGAVTVGDGARIGANAIVLTHVPAGKLAFGVPAQIVPFRAATPEDQASRTRADSEH